MGNLPLSGYQLYPCNGSYLPQTCKESKEKKKAPLFSTKKILMQIVVIAVPSTLQQSFISLGNIVIQSIINGFGALLWQVTQRLSS